jgi:hypothetical protein
LIYFLIWFNHLNFCRLLIFKHRLFEHFEQYFFFLTSMHHLILYYNSIKLEFPFFTSQVLKKIYSLNFQKFMICCFYNAKTWIEIRFAFLNFELLMSSLSESGIQILNLRPFSFLLNCQANFPMNYNLLRHLVYSISFF